MGISDIIDANRGVDPDAEAGLLAGLNQEQREAVLHGEGPALLVAVAGAGKTRVLVHRLARLVKVEGIHPGRILAVTFSKKGADEMNERLKALIGSTDARVGTFHSVALEIHRTEALGSFGDDWDWKIDDRDRFRVILKEITGFRHMNWKKADVTSLTSYIGSCKAAMARPGSDEAIQLAESTYVKSRSPKNNPALLHEAYERAEKLRRERRLLTFDDMLFDSVEALRDNEDLRIRWASRWDWVMQDEAQDQNLAQLLMGSLLARDHKNYVLVGDPAQCHPPGTMITTDIGPIAIEHLSQETSSVSGWDRKSQKMVGGRSIRIGTRHYAGTIYGMRVSGRSVGMTDNHKVLCRWTNASADNHVVYLMYRDGFGYRVGHCKLMASRGKSRNLHLVTRAKLEGADKVWILNVCKDGREASIEESIVAANYGIPTATFSPVHNNINLDEEAIQRIFDEVDSASGAKRCLAVNDLNPDLPFWPWPMQEVDGKIDDDVAYRRSTYFPVYACNLIPGLMSVPLPDDRNVWATISEIAFTRNYNGPVYSLDVEKDHSYAANGIVVLNCIYTWRGARPEKLLAFETEWGAKVIKMGRNYRCGSTIVSAANKSLSAMDPSTKLPIDMICERGTEGTVTSTEFMSLEDEGESVAAQISQLITDGTCQPRDITILFRTNAQSRAPEEGLICERIPYRILGGTSFYERREVKCLLSYLRISSGHGSFSDWLDNMERAINAPFRYLGKRYVERVREVAKNQARESKSSGDRFSWLSVVREANDQAGIQRRQRASAESWASMIEDIRHVIQQGAADGANVDAKEDALPARILDRIVHETGYTQWLVRDEGEESTENSRVSNVREMIRAAGRFPTVKELLDYVDKTIRASREKRGQKDPNKVTLCSIHRSKGLEWPVVFVIGCAHGILPHGRAEDPEEERRLFYVASTRARDELHYSYAINVAIGNRVVKLPPSAYLSEVGHIPSPEPRRSDDVSDIDLN